MSRLDTMSRFEIAGANDELVYIPTDTDNCTLCGEPLDCPTSALCQFCYTDTLERFKAYLRRLNTAQIDAIDYEVEGKSLHDLASERV